MNRDGNCRSLWQNTARNADFINTLNPDLSNEKFDVVIVGGGITGISTGLLLQNAGKKVLIAEAQNIGFGTTGGTTAHLNTFLDTPYSTIIKKFGENDAQLVASAVSESLKFIKHNINTYNIECGYEQLPGYLFSQDEKQTEELEDIYKATLNCNVAVEWSDEIPVPIPFIKALRFPGQASFHPTRYLNGIANAFIGAGGTIIENCRVTGIVEGSPHVLNSSKGDINAHHLIYATHVPPGVNLLHFRCAPYRSYAMAAKLSGKEAYPSALVYDMYDPYHYYRTQEIDGEYFFIAGGEDHKTGHETNTDNCFRKLEAHINKYFPVDTVVNKWSSQYFEPTDGLPYIGQLPGHTDNIYVATGYSGNGMVYSGVAAIVLRDMITGKESPFIELFDPNRIKLVAGFSNFVKEAADVTSKLISSLLPSQKLEQLLDLAPGEATVKKAEGHTLAIYKNEKGDVFALNAACTHIKCEVAWNSAEKTWDCPCHGSRFSYTGEMLTAPARKDLEQIKVKNSEKV